MEQRLFGQTGMKVSALGLGGAAFGMEQDFNKVDKMLNSALDTGVNVIDTAEYYVQSEEFFGRALASRRDDFYLFTKCGYAAGFDYPDWDPVLLEKSIDRSLKRLNTEYVDVIHLHSCSEEVLRQGDVIEVLKRANEQGKTRFIGYSGDTTDALWRYDELPTTAYPYVYWERLRELNYDFLENMEESIDITLRFALSTVGVATAIVDTNNPDRWEKNAEFLKRGALAQDVYKDIRARWKEVEHEDWVGKT
ncbi:aldo/keto reductase [Paenibacillus glacialis]|uniref:Aldo/keto reductase n=1 Tax=Paenibacillus glacialis TaxID=494026 RepID=A0A168KRS3_9BACL|nr:aldo/keto reductase [Paenibacillus glacialis]OAB42380.1 aldo/keto reductase [Paenibacillus glacialis]